MSQMKYVVKKIPFTQGAREYLCAHHYTKTVPSCVQAVFGLFDHDRMLGITTFGRFPGATVERVYPGYIHFSRMFVEDECPKNTESFFIGKCLRLLQKENKWVGVISYADPRVGHTGTIYKASNFEFIGESKSSYHYETQDGEVIHARSISNEALNDGLTSREVASRSDLKKVKGIPKKIYRYKFKFRKTSKKGMPVECKPSEFPDNYDESIHTCIAIAKKEILIDKEYLTFLLSRKGYISGGYFHFRDGKYSRSFHRYITNARDGYHVDHLNRNRLDNRRCNLEEKHPSSNLLNKSVKGFRGVSFKKKSYEASIGFLGDNIYLGRFKIEAEAARAYDLACIKFYGRHAQLNFPEEHDIKDALGEIDKATVTGKTVKNYFGKVCSVCKKLAYGSSELCYLHLKQRKNLNKGSRRHNARVMYSTELCTTEGCGKPTFSRNLCSLHYAEERKKEGYVKPEKKIPTCSIENCTTKVIRQGLCTIHWKQKNGIPIGKITGRPKKEYGNCHCGEKADYSNGFCKKHYREEWRKKNLVQNAYKAKCFLEGCEKFSVKEGMCQSHWREKTGTPKKSNRKENPVQPKNPCAAVGCDLLARNIGQLCDNHKHLYVPELWYRGVAFGMALREEREKAGVHGKQIAAYLGHANDCGVRNIEKGRSGVMEKVILEVCRRFGISTDFLNQFSKIEIIPGQLAGESQKVQ